MSSSTWEPGGAELDKLDVLQGQVEDLRARFPLVEVQLISGDNAFSGKMKEVFQPHQLIADLVLIATPEVVLLPPVMDLTSVPECCIDELSSEPYQVMLLIEKPNQPSLIEAEFVKCHQLEQPQENVKVVAAWRGGNLGCMDTDYDLTSESLEVQGTSKGGVAATKKINIQSSNQDNIVKPTFLLEAKTSAGLKSADRIIEENMNSSDVFTLKDSNAVLTSTTKKPLVSDTCKTITLEIRQTKGEKCKICGEFRVRMKQHMKYHTKKQHFCQFCSKSFDKKHTLTLHIRSHTGEKPYGCTNCSKTFSRKGKLTSHMKTHTNEKPYCCRICSRAFARSDTLNIHVRTHSGDKSNRCRTCSKTFSTFYQLKLHQQIHSGGTTYDCMVCKRVCSTPLGLSRHLDRETHARVTIISLS